jgi:hypothetical protein
MIGATALLLLLPTLLGADVAVVVVDTVVSWSERSLAGGLLQSKSATSGFAM